MAPASHIHICLSLLLQTQPNNVGFDKTYKCECLKSKIISGKAETLALKISSVRFLLCAIYTGEVQFLSIKYKAHS